MFWLRKWRRNRIAARQFPDRWLQIIEKNVLLYNRLPAEDKAELQKHILIFIAEKRFEGCGGLEITDEIKIVIAAQACMLLLHRKTDYYPGLSSILVYPHAFIVHRAQHLADGVVAEGPQVLSGESWRTGSVVLSWDNVKHGCADIHDGQNVVFHEFAHQIDSSGGKGDRSGVLKSTSSYITWARVLQKDYQRLREAAQQNRPAFLDKYGATDPAEFFAVATEFFFEKPQELKQIHPDLYNELKRFYHQDPAGFK
ncbi:MAG: zinc-dependent peptidase [Phycisphaerae bacterium]|nr:zinc-dependent peptidase [Phycisphaerae bacterium]